MGNWDHKYENSRLAREHTKKMNELYAYEIKISSDQTKLYDVDFRNNDNIERDTEILVRSADSVSSIFVYNWRNTAVLNFASYKNPGGMFLQGSMAQEECLCHSSFLYNVLSQKTDYYDWNNDNLNRALYKNRALFSPQVRFFNDEDESIEAGVITCAAPYKTVAQKRCGVTDEQNYKALDGRIRFVLDIARDQKIDTLILGAFGCGVFGQNPQEVAEIFKKYLTTTHKSFDKVVFAIPGGNDNYEAFKRVFE